MKNILFFFLFLTTTMLLVSYSHAQSESRYLIQTDDDDVCLKDPHSMDISKLLINEN